MNRILKFIPFPSIELILLSRLIKTDLQVTDIEEYEDEEDIEEYEDDWRYHDTTSITCRGREMNITRSSGYITDFCYVNDDTNNLS